VSVKWHLWSTRIYRPASSSLARFDATLIVVDIGLNICWYTQQQNKELDVDHKSETQVAKSETEQGYVTWNLSFSDKLTVLLHPPLPVALDPNLQGLSLQHVSSWGSSSLALSWRVPS